FRAAFPVISSAAGESSSAPRQIPADIIPHKEKDFSIVAYLHCNSPEDLKRIDFDKITHLHYAFLNPDAEGNFAYSACLDSLVRIAHANGVSVLTSIGGGSAPEYYSDLLSDSKRHSLINNLIQIALYYNLDGIDVDLEGSRIDLNYEDFVTELRAAL